ncbi:MAG TPA: T9SS type A sorting domain-containing protein, partial [Flavobacterium sp.]
DVITTDLDGDGDQDVVYMFNNWPTNQILWQRNEDGLGAFGAAIVINSNVDSNGASTLSAGDIDNDADIDIFVGESTKTTWLENLYGQANFEPPKIIADDISTPSSSQLLDYDEDGDLDLLIASRGSNKVIWYKNEGITKNTIKGGVRLDIEGNGCEAGDTLLPNILVSTTNGSTTQATLTFQNEFAGQYRLYTNPGEYETSVIAELPAYFMLTPLSHATTFTGVGNIDTADFCIEPIGQYNDLIVALYPLDDARPGFDASYQLVYRNIGTTTLTGQVALQYDNTKMQFLNAATTPTSQTINTLYFGFADFAPFESRTVIINFNVLAPPTTNIGDNLSFNTTIESAVADYTPDDNTLILNQTVIGSYDPNDITCLEGSQVLIADADKYLHYVIRFQNTGTASAINVKVQHQLDQKLDWTTFQLMGMSHNGRTTITDGSMVEFMFNNIHLPDSTSNEAGSHGYITFAIKPKNNTLSVGDVVNATAGIYFDFNPPVITNTAATEYVEFLGIDSFNTDTIVIYPNPATEQISISGVGEILQIEIFNILGSKVFDAKDTNKVDISSLDSGVYLISIQTESGSGFKKFIKE